MDKYYCFVKISQPLLNFQIVILKMHEYQFQIFTSKDFQNLFSMPQHFAFV